MGIKPSDKWTISLCRDCHSMSHRIGEDSFAKKFNIDLKQLAEEFFQKSPHRSKLSDAKQEWT